MQIRYRAVFVLFFNLDVTNIKIAKTIASILP